MTRRLVLIEWVDASQAGSGWRATDVVAGQNEPLRCRSVGWLLRRTKESTTVAAHVSGDGQEVREFVNGDITIPNCAIVRMRTLKP